jgi:hypothetical protein
VGKLCPIKSVSFLLEFDLEPLTIKNQLILSAGFEDIRDADCDLCDGGAANEKSFVHHICFCKENLVWGFQVG